MVFLIRLPVSNVICEPVSNVICEPVSNVICEPVYRGSALSSRGHGAGRSAGSSSCCILYVAFDLCKYYNMFITWVSTLLSHVINCYLLL